MRRASGLLGVSVVLAVMFFPSHAAAFTPVITEFNTTTPNAGPFGIAAGPDGNMWFTERNTDKIGRITPAGVVSEFSLPTPSSDPFAIAAGSDGNMWFTEDGGNNIGRITMAGVITEFALPTPSALPSRITLGPDGNMWFTEALNGIGKITTAGVITEFSTGGFSNPDGIAPGPDGNVWFIDNFSSAISMITPTGTVTSVPLPGGISSPQLLALDSAGNLWFNDFSTHVVVRMAPDHTFTSFALPSAPFNVYDMQTGVDGNVWLTDPAADVITTVTHDGVVTDYHAPSGSGVSGVGAGADGNMWYTDQTTSRIGRITLPPKPLIANSSITVQSGKTITANVLAGVANNPAAATLSIVSGPSHGTATANTTTGIITYTAASGFVGADSLTFRVCSADNTGICSQAVLSMDVTSGVGVPDTGYGVYTGPSGLLLIGGAAIVAGTVLVAAAGITRHRVKAYKMIKHEGR